MLGEKRMTYWVRTLKALALVAASVSLLGSGCAQPEPIDRVQPNLVNKSDLTGEWYILDTVTRAPYASHVAHDVRVACGGGNVCGAQQHAVDNTREEGAHVVHREPLA